MKVMYCANCSALATKLVQAHFVVSKSGDPHPYPLTPLCAKCATAYEWGQASPKVATVDIEALGTEEGEPYL